MQLLGLEFADLDAAAAADLFASRPASAPFGYVTTPNTDHLVRLHRRPELWPLYQNAMLRLLDSRVVALAARLVGLTAPCVAPGSDLTALLLARHLTPVSGSPSWACRRAGCRRWLRGAGWRHRHTTIHRKASSAIRWRCGRRWNSC